MAEATPDAKSEWDAVAAEREAPAVAIEEAAPAQAAAADAVAEPVAAAPAVDPYEGLSEDVKTKLGQFDSLSELVKQQALQLKETAGRVASMQSEFAKSRQAQPAGDAPSSAAVKQAAKDPEKWAALKKDFPEWGEGIGAFVDARIDELKGLGVTPEQLEQYVAQRVGTATAEISTKFEHALVGMKYPTWRDEVKTPDFEAWFAAQKPEVQALAASPNGADAIQMLDTYHESKKTPVVRETRAAKLAAAVTTTKPGAAAPAAKSYEDMTPKQQWDYEAAQRARKQAA
jgi:hypothetical protein